MDLLDPDEFDVHLLLSGREGETMRYQCKKACSIVPQWNGLLGSIRQSSHESASATDWKCAEMRRFMDDGRQRGDQSMEKQSEVGTVYFQELSGYGSRSHDLLLQLIC
jgi:hypothetical protein